MFRCWEFIWWLRVNRTKGKKKGKGSESHLMQTDHRLRNQKHHPVKS